MQSIPKARIAWLVQPGGRELIEANPALDEVIVWPRGEWRSLWRGFRWWRLFGELRRFRRELRARNFDLAIDLQGLLKSGLCAGGQARASASAWARKRAARGS